MFSTLKDKLLTVKKNVGIFSNNGDTNSVQCNEINLNVGNDILTHFQNHWSIIHATSEENAKQLNDISQTINEIYQRIKQDKENFTTIINLLTNSNLCNQITNCTQQLNQLYIDFGNVEDELVQLEDLIETVEFENMKQQHKFHLDQYEFRKNESLANFEKSLKDKYEKTAVEVELKKKQELEERQQVFQEAFKNDLEMFKNFGTIPKLDLPKQPSALLEEIQVDYDEKELDQFFDDENPSTNQQS